MSGLIITHLRNVVFRTTLRTLFHVFPANVAKNTTFLAKKHLFSMKKAKLLHVMQHLLLFREEIK